MAKTEMPNENEERKPVAKPVPKKQTPQNVHKKGRVRKRTATQRFVDDTIDEFGSFGNWALDDVIMPTILETLSSIGHGLIDRLIPDTYGYGYGSGYRYGRSRHRDYDDFWDDDYYGRRRKRKRRYYDEDDDDDDYYGRRRKRRRRSRSDDFDYVEFDYKQDRDLVLDRISAALRKNGEVSVAKIKRWSGCDDDVERTDNKWGYTTMEDMHKRQKNGMFIIEFDEPEPLDNY